MQCEYEQWCRTSWEHTQRAKWEFSKKINVSHKPGIDLTICFKSKSSLARQLEYGKGYLTACNHAVSTW